LEHFRRLSETLVFTRNSSLEGRVWVSQKPEWIKDVSTAAKQLFSRAEIAKKVGLKAGLGIPIVANDNVLAVLVFFMSESREEDKRLVELISAVGAQLGSAMRRKKVEAELRESEERYRTLVETLPNAILVELYDQLVYVNPTGLRLLGHDSLGELEGYSLEDLFDETTGAEIKKIKEAINIEVEKDKMQGAELGNLVTEGKIIQKDGKAIIVDMIFTATTYLGKPALRVVANDITETKRLREAAQKMERLAALGQFSTTIAHEIRNPLGALSLNFEFLSSRMEIPAAHQKKFQHFGQGITRIRKIIDGILDYARPMELALKPTNIHHVLDSGLHSVMPDLQEAGIVIEKNYEVTHPEVLIDPNQMVKVFANLFSNAKEAMNPGGRLMIQTLARNQTLEVQIKDNGKGIAPENLENIFHPFFTTKGEGVGLGLAVVSRILEEHRVPISVESKAGGGTKFTVKFPQTL
jgi:PAS domain S-box-containing protein